MKPAERAALSWVIGVAGFGAGLAVFLFTTFETKADAQSKASTIERIESKVDSLLLKFGIDLNKFKEDLK